MMKRKGQFVMSMLIAAAIGIAVILILGIIFYKSINSSVIAVVDFMKHYGVYIFAMTLAVIFKEPLIQLAYMIMNFFKRFIG